MKKTWDKMGRALGVFSALLVLANSYICAETIAGKDGWSATVNSTSTATGGTVAVRYVDPSGNSVAGYDIKVVDSGNGNSIARYTYTDGTWFEVTIIGAYDGKGSIQLIYRSNDGQRISQSIEVAQDGQVLGTTRDDKTGETWVTTARKNPETGKLEPVTKQTVPPSSGKGSSKGENAPTAGPMPSAGVSPGLTQELQRDKLR